ncbi:MAG: sigma-70 family RNA polymerase sigma factor [Phycisphaerae bacterium]|nr:sigma-70 family RNA polymerase sigma factor [Phycisphaerae bacterium]
MNELSDEHLMSQAMQGSKDCFEQIVLRHSGSLLRFVGSSVRVAQDAEDIVQDVFLNVYANMNRFDCEGSFKAWLYTIAYNCKNSYLRKKRVRCQPLEVVQRAQVSPEEILTQKQEVASVWALASTLSASQSTAIWLRYHEQMDVSQIALVMKKSRMHVRVLLHRARTRLAGMMNEPV